MVHIFASYPINDCNMIFFDDITKELQRIATLSSEPLFFCLRSQINICASHKELNIHTQNTCAIYKNNSGCPPFAMCNDLNDLFFTALIFAHRQKMVHPPKISVKWFLVKEFVPRHINSYSTEDRVNARLSVTKIMIQARKKTWSNWTF